MNNTPPAPKASFTRTAALWLTGGATLITATQITASSDLERGLLSITALVGAAAIITAMHDGMAAARRTEDAADIAERLEDARDAEITAHLIWHARRDRATQSGTVATYRTPETLEALEAMRHKQDMRYLSDRRRATTRENVVQP